MTCIIDAKSKRRLSAKLAAGLTISAVIVLGTLAAPASAEDHHHGRHAGFHHDHRGHEHWRGGYHSPPPVVYGSPYAYAPPPVVYGPGVGVNLGFQIR